jgi:hypothetical protein
MVRPFPRWPFRLPKPQMKQMPQLPFRRMVGSSASAEKPSIRLNILDPHSDKPEICEFDSVKALREWVRWHQRGLLSILRDGKPPLVLQSSRYNSLDPNAVYSITSTFHTQALLPTKHNRILDKAWENRCRLRLIDWFDERGMYVIEMERALYEQGRDASPAAEWEGIWKGLDGTVYLLECKYQMDAVYSAVLRRL